MVERLPRRHPIRRTNRRAQAARAKGLGDAADDQRMPATVGAIAAEKHTRDTAIGQKLRGGVETHLTALGFRVRTARTESHLCCGSAGTYSVLQPELAYPLRDRKLAALDDAFAEGEQPAAILSANIGCITHLQSGTDVPVRHWVEVLDEALRPGAL